MKKYIILITTLVLLLTGCTQLKEYNKNLFFMDTYINIKVYMNNPKPAKKILDGASKIYEKYQKITNKYDLESEVSKINANLTHQVSDELYEILELGSTWYDKSDGLFNINMGNLIDVWKNHKENDGKLPTPEELNIEIKKIELRNKKVYSNNLDLGAIAKGFTTQ
ncbi:MAG: FAD:protein FMN transferase, partial [Bacilli bacterium]